MIQHKRYLLSCEQDIIECLFRFGQPMTEFWIYDNLCSLYTRTQVRIALSVLYKMDCLGISTDKDWYLLNLHSPYVITIISRIPCA